MSSSPAQKGSQYRGRLHKRATRSRFHFDVKSSSVQVIAAIPIPSAVSQARRKGTKKRRGKCFDGMRKNKKNRIKRDGQPRWKKGDVAALNKEHNTSSRDRRARKNARISRFKTNCYTVRVNKTKKKARPLHQQATTSDERENAVNHSNHSVEGFGPVVMAPFFHRRRGATAAHSAYRSDTSNWPWTSETDPR